MNGLLFHIDRPFYQLRQDRQQVLCHEGDWRGKEAVSRYGGKPGVHDASANLRLTGQRTLDLFQRNGIKYVGDGKYISILL